MFAQVQFLYSFFSAEHILLAIMLLSFLLKGIILCVSIRHSFKTSLRLLSVFISLFLVGALLSDFGYILTFFLRRILLIKGELLYYTFICRVVWSFYITQYQAIVLFFEHMLQRTIKFNVWYVFHGAFNIAVSIGFLYLAFFKYNVSSGNPDTLWFELSLINAIHIYVPILFLPMFYKIFRSNKAQKMPRILQHQMRYLTSFIVPYLLLDTFNNGPTFITSIISKDYKYIFATLTTMLSTYPMYFFAKKIMGLRFLNIRKDVESTEKFNFLSQFKDILEQLSYATALKELALVSQSFFQVAFNIPLGRTRLFVRKLSEKEEHGYSDIADISAKVEQFISKSDSLALNLLSRTKIFIRDEIVFSDFYEDESLNKEILKFMDLINADIFLPIYERNIIIAYSIVERDARPEKLYTNKERDEMLVFTSYLSNIINILKYSDVEAIHHRQKELLEELYYKHQENTQYKESLRSFLLSNKERKIGIIFYKHRRFTCANEAAHELIGFDLNSNQNHPLTQTLRATARKVQEFKSAQTAFVSDRYGNRLVVSGLPGLEDYMTILQIYHPEISDIIKTQLDLLKDPSYWDYVLYLETTKSGQLINKLLPGTGEKILNFKIALLSTALSKKATLLSLPEDDLLSTVEILHHVSLRQTLHTIKLTGPERNNEVAVALFGLNPILQKESPAEPLLQKLNDVGTLYIQNIEYLSFETQSYLAEFIFYGFFRKFKSDHKIFSNVRIISSTSKDLLELVHQNLFSHELFKELNKTSLTLPSLLSFSESEMNELVQGFAQQIESSPLQRNVPLSDKDKLKLLKDRPLSLKELKERVHRLILQKATNEHTTHEITNFNPAYDASEPDIAHAVRLGKKALKDEQIMTLLWKKFKNQNK